VPGFEAILFDFDGVLLDSEPVHCACWREVLAPLGVPLTWEVYAARCVGEPDRAMMEILAGLCDPPVDARKLWEQYARKQQLFRERMAVDPPFAPGVAEFFGELSGRYKLAVVSSSGRGEVEPPLEAAGIRAYLGTLVCGEDVERHKPAPDPYLLAARRLGVRHALVVEDSLAGMASARAAGFEAVRVTDPARTIEIVRERLGLSSARTPRRRGPRKRPA
jgi:HAD superfamily hydrolase (TIGR01509 family)